MMKINRFLGLAAIALLAIGAMGFVSARANAQAITPTAPQAQVTQPPDTAPAAVADTDQTQVEENVGGTSGVDTVAETAMESTEVASSDILDAAPSGTPSISADAAIKAAQAYLNTTAAGTATLDDENGTLIYSVGINGSEVKVNAMNGNVTSADQNVESQTGGGN